MYYVILKLCVVLMLIGSSIFTVFKEYDSSTYFLLLAILFQLISMEK